MIDFVYSKVKRFGIEALNNLPTDLTSDHTGYTVLYNDRLWFWNGFRWCTWNNLPWSNETDLSLDSANPRTETQLVVATSSFLANGKQNINLSYGYDDLEARTLGMFEFLGASLNIDDWRKLEDIRFCLTAANGCWFNIRNNSNNQAPSNHKRIITKTQTDLFFVTKAEFTYSYYADAWILLNYAKRHWFGRFQFNPRSISAPETEINIDVLLPVGNRYYQFDIFCKTRELDASLNEVPTTTSRMLEIYSSVDDPMLIDYSVAGSIFVRSLQGSGIIKVGQNRMVYVRITLPNGATKYLDYGYIHLEEMDETINLEMTV